MPKEKVVRVGDLLKILSKINPRLQVLVAWGPGDDHYSQAGSCIVNTYDMDTGEFFVDGPGEEKPEKDHCTVAVFVIHPGYGGLPE